MCRDRQLGKGGVLSTLDITVMDVPGSTNPLFKEQHPLQAAMRLELWALEDLFHYRQFCLLGECLPVTDPKLGSTGQPFLFAKALDVGVSWVIKGSYKCATLQR